MPKRNVYTESKELRKEACPKCPSSDGFAIYDDNHGHCFVCGHHVNNLDKEGEVMPLDTSNEVFDYREFEAATGDPRGCKERGITKTVAEYFDVRVDYDADRNITAYHYPYTGESVKVVAIKTRTLPKSFKTKGDFKDVWPFGYSRFTAGGKRLVITEGEFDAMAIAQASLSHYDRIYPVISIASASNLKSLLLARDWIRSFEEVVLFFDADDAGREAVKKAANIIGIDKVKVVSSNAKDPCDLLVSEGYYTVMQSIWNAQPYSPAGIIVGHDMVWEQYISRLNTESVPYPECLGGINDKVAGMRQGEITLFTSGTGSGKSTVIKEIALNLLKETTDKIGLVSLEESVGDTAEKFLQMALGKNFSEEDVPLEEQEAASREVFGSERIVLLDHQGAVADESLIDKIEYMALLGCKYIVLDHITIAVSEGADGLTGNEAIDKVMSDLLKITKKHNIWLGVISHLRKVAVGSATFEQGKLPSLDDIKGSGSIKQISFDIIGFARDMTNEDETIRNTINFIVLKSRFTGKTGPAGHALYDHMTTRLSRHVPLEVDFEVL